MDNTLNSKAEKIKNNIKGTAEKSKETIKEIIASNSKYLGDAINSNKKIVDSIKEKLNQQEIEDSVTDTLKKTFGKSVELAEEALDSIINSYTKQLQMNVDFNTKLVEMIKESKNGSPEKTLEFILENFEATRQLTINSTKEIFNFYNQHTNLSMDFNQQLGKNITTQIESFSGLQNNSMNKFTAYASEWWK